MSKIGGYLIEAEMLGEIEYDERKRRYIKTSDLGSGGQHTFTERSKVRKRTVTSHGDEGSNV